MSSKAPLAPDRSVVTEIAQGDIEALGELMRRHGRTVYALAYSILVDPGEADDVVAETFEQARRAAARFLERASGSVFTWLTEIARSLARGLLLAREWPRRLAPERGPASRHHMEIA